MVQQQPIIYIWSVLECKNKHYIFEKQQIFKTFYFYNSPLSFTTEKIFFENLSRYLTSVDCARALNQVFLDKRKSVCRNRVQISFLIFQHARMDCMKDFINFVQARTEATSKLSTEITLTKHVNVRQIQISAFRLLWSEKWQKKWIYCWKQNPTKSNLDISDFCSKKRGRNEFKWKPKKAEFLLCCCGRNDTPTHFIFFGEFSIARRQNVGEHNG